MKAPPLDPVPVHVWAASLQTAGEAWADLRVELAPDERARADRFHTPQLQRRFVVARAILRRLLAAYARVDAAALRIGYGKHGKPFLLDAPEIRFNVSHADDAAIYAIASEREVGIDIEATGRNVEIAGVARHAFSSHECEVLTALAPDARREVTPSFASGRARKPTSRRAARVSAARPGPFRYCIATTSCLSVTHSSATRATRPRRIAGA